MFSRTSSFAGSLAPRNVSNQTFQYFVLTFNYSTATITKTTNVTGKVFYHPTTRGF